MSNVFLEVRHPDTGLVVLDHRSNNLHYKSKQSVTGTPGQHIFYVRAWEQASFTPIVAFRLSAVRFFAVEVHGDIEVFAALPSPASFPDQLVIIVTGVGYYRKLSGSWSSISAGSVTKADRSKYRRHSLLSPGTSASFTAELYLFDVTSNAQKFAGPGTFFGCEIVYQGNLVFTTANKAAEVVGDALIDLTFAQVSANTVVCSIDGYNSGRQYAVMHLPHRQTTQYAGGFRSFMYSAVRQNGGNFDTFYVLMNSGAGSPVPNTTFPYALLVFDVTGLT